MSKFQPRVQAEGIERFQAGKSRGDPMGSFGGIMPTPRAVVILERCLDRALVAASPAGGQKPR